MDKSIYILSSVSKALLIMDLLSEHDRLGITDIYKRLGNDKSSTFRLLYTLEAGGYVTKTSDAKYSLSVKFAQYGTMILGRQNLSVLARFHLRKLRDACGHTANLAILGLDGKGTLIYKEQSNVAYQMGTAVGFGLDAYCTGTGKMMLSQLPSEEQRRYAGNYNYQTLTEHTITSSEELLERLKTIREQGYAEDNEESEIGLTCYAAPVYNIEGVCIAAISVAGSTYRMQQTKETTLPMVMETALRISIDLGYKPPAPKENR